MFCLFLLSSLSTPFALTPSSVYSWIDQQASNEHAKFFHEYGTLSESFHTDLLKWSNTQLKRSTKAAITLHQTEQCTEGALFKSMSPTKVAPNGSETEHQFVESLFLIESSYCLPSVDLQKTYDVFMSTDFRINVMPQVVSFTKSGQTSCVQSSGVTGILLPSEYCTINRILQDTQNILVYSSLSSAKTDPEHQPLYFREEIILFSQMSTGVAVYRATFSRSQDLGMTSKYLLRNTVDSSQAKICDELYQWLQK